MAIVNKDLIQSYIMTTAKYDFNVYEKRIIYRLVEMAQGEVQGVKFANNCQKIEHDLFSCVNITMPIACLLNGEEDKNYARVKESLQSLQRKYSNMKMMKFGKAFLLSHYLISESVPLSSLFKSTLVYGTVFLIFPKATENMS